MDVAITWNPAVADPEIVASNRRRLELAPGSAAWKRNDAGVPRRLFYICPCGCGLTKVTSITRAAANAGVWNWDGDEARPTFSPSIQHTPSKTQPCTWHGNLIGGVWREA